MKEFVLRDLTEQEHEKLNSFIANGTTELYQYFLGIIITDLIPEGEVSIERALEKVAENEAHDDPKDYPFSVCGLIDAWIRLCMEYKNYGLVDSLDIFQTRGLKFNRDVMINGFVNCLWNVWIGNAGKKQVELEDNYAKMVLNGFSEGSNVPIFVNPELMYRFVMTYVEYLGFRLIAQSDNKRTIDLAMFGGIEF